LTCEEVDVRRIAERVGTPVFIYSEAAIRDGVRRIRAGLENRPIHFRYAIKANSNPHILKLIDQEGFGVDVVSGGELEIALEAGAPASRIVFAGCGKQEWEIRAALDLDVSFVSIESPFEVETLERLLREYPHSRARMLVRANPGVGGGTHRYMVTGLEENKFGTAADEVVERYAQWQRQLDGRIDGIQIHIGSGITEIDFFATAAEMAVSIVTRIRANGGRVSVLDFGGGVGVRFDSDAPVDWRRYKEIVVSLQEKLGVEIVLEPGKSVLAESCVALAGVVQCKAGVGRHFLIVDMAMNDLMRPALYQAYHHVLPLWTGSEPAETVIADVVGPVCESGDFLAQKRLLPKLAPGDMVALLTAGAYGYSMSSNYNERPRAAEVLVSGGAFQVIRERESLGARLRAKYGTR
jgi:diaminopimelate decarboxylase